MSAYLDRTQGFTFVFSNIYELYRKAKDAKLDEPFVANLRPEKQAVKEGIGRVIKHGQAQEKIKEFKPEKVSSERTFSVPMGVREAEEKAMRQKARPLSELQRSLGDLKDAHAKLRFLLKEIEDLTEKKK